MSISIPQQAQCESTGENSGRFTIANCYPGYGMTIGNALRRVLLSSLGGTAITAVKIDAVSHEFSGIDGVMEDVVQIILNLKRVRVRSALKDTSITMMLNATGEGVVTAGQIKTPADVEIVNPDHVIATITDKKSKLVMELEITTGIGYIPVEQQIREEKEIGKMAIDAIFTPIQRVNYTVENMRVGKRTDYDKVTIDVITDGSITPQEAFDKGVQILIDQFKALSGESVSEQDDDIEDIVEEVSNSAEDIIISNIEGLSTRTVNVLDSAKISTISDISSLSSDDILALDGMGAKGVKEITDALEAHNITLS